MFVYNLKISSNKLFKTILFAIIIIATIILIISILTFYLKTSFTINDSLPSNSIANIESNEYTNILKEVYEDVDTYVGQTINFTGYVYKLYDLKDSEFVLARDMLINSDSQTVVVGFLCSSKDTPKYEEGTWVNVTGTIIKGYYHNVIPVIDISKIEKVDTPTDCYVYPPDNTYIPTSVIL